jgi:hypothetical protein
MIIEGLKNLTLSGLKKACYHPEFMQRLVAQSYCLSVTPSSRRGEYAHHNHFLCSFESRNLVCTILHYHNP